jgi:hypothetical protein
MMRLVSIEDHYARHAQRVALESARQQQEIENKARCGRACDLSDFEPMFIESTQERIE